MRLCRFRHDNRIQVGYYDDQNVVSVSTAAEAFRSATGESITLPSSDSLLDFLPPDGAGAATANRIGDWLAAGGAAQAVPHTDVELLVPIPRPNKLLLLAGNYAKHIEEGGGKAEERADTFPYVFMKPPSTTLVDPGQPVRIPSVSPQHIDWELELAVVIGRTTKGVSEAEALSYVAGYTIVVDMSDRKFKPNPQRKERSRDEFFDWLHGKWHDSFCPCGPCVATPASVPNPQQLEMKLRVNDHLHQDASTSQQIFPVAAVVEFISSFVTLEPGDIISTGTPHGVGSSSGTYLKPGDRIDASIGSIGTLVSPVTA